MKTTDLRSIAGNVLAMKFVFIFLKNCIIGGVIPCFLRSGKKNLQKSVFLFGV